MKKLVLAFAVRILPALRWIDERLVGVYNQNPEVAPAVRSLREAINDLEQSIKAAR